MNIFIDSEIWSFSQKIPKKEKFSSNEEFEKAMELHTLSNNFLKEQIRSNRICMTYHQISEIYHILGFRGKKTPLKDLNEFCSNLLNSKFINWFIIDEVHISKAINLSLKSKIHIWDYLCVLPLINQVDYLYTCDKHFLDDTFQNLGPEIVNPLKKWIIL